MNRIIQKWMAILVAIVLVASLPSAVFGEGVNSDLQQGEPEQGEWVLLREADYSHGELTREEESTYQNGLLTEVTLWQMYYRGGESYTVRKYSYDTEGRITGTESYDLLSGMPVAKQVWTYDEADNLKHVDFFNKSGILRQEQTFSYSEDGCTVETFWYNDNHQVSSRTVDRQDANHHSLGYELYDELGELSHLTVTDYDEYGRKTQEHDWAYGLYEAEMVSTFYYDESGRLLRCEERYLNGSLVGEEGLTKYSYDEYGNLTETRSIWEGEERSREAKAWGLLRDGEIVEVSDEAGLLAGGSLKEAALLNPPATSDLAVDRRSRGEIHFDRTTLLDDDGLRVTALDYYADGDVEGILFSAENYRDAMAEIRIVVAVNGKNLGIWHDIEVPAQEVRRERLYLDIDSMKAADIEKIEAITFRVTATVLTSEDKEEVVEAPEVTVSVTDNRERVSSMIPIQRYLIQEEKVDVLLTWYEKTDDIKLYYTINNRSDASLWVVSLQSTINGQMCSGHPIFSICEPHSVTFDKSYIYFDKHEKIGDLKTLEFNLEFSVTGYKPFAEAESIRLEFDPDGQVSTIESTLSVDRDSECWQRYFMP